MTNKAFARAVHSLGHPITILAVAALLLNDHWLRYAAPSWFTGKIGDAAWLCFAPLIGALVVSWLLPSSWPNQEKWVGVISFGLIGVWFATAKTLAPVHLLTTTALDALVGWQGGLRMDTTDLLTLPALAIGWMVWQRTTPDPRSRYPFTALPAIALGLMATLANSCPVPDPGIIILCQTENAIYSLSGYSYSTRGYLLGVDGVRWHSINLNDIPSPCKEKTQKFLIGSGEAFPRSWELATEIAQFRLVKGEGIYAAAPGQPERLEVDFSDRRHGIYKRFYQKVDDAILCGPGVRYEVGPFDALYDPARQRLYVAMGLEGTLMREADGRWWRVGVGPYQPVDIGEVEPILQSLQDEFRLALALLFLLPPTIAYLASWIRGIGPLLGIGVIWLFWLFSLFNMVTRVFAGLLGLPILVPVSLFVGLVFVQDCIQRRIPLSMLLRLGLLSIGTAALYLLPHILWARQTIPNYNTAREFSWILLAACLVAARQYMRSRYPSPKAQEEMPVAAGQ